MSIRKRSEVRTGIYDYDVYECDGPDMMAALKAYADGWNPQLQLARCREKATAVLQEHGLTWPECRREVYRDTTPPVVRDAGNLLVRVEVLEQIIAKMGDKLTPSEIANLTINAIAAGGLVERLQVRPHEPVVMDRKKATLGLRVANREKHGDLEKNRRKAGRVFRQIKKQHPEKKKDALVRLTADALGISTRTVYKHLQQSTAHE